MASPRRLTHTGHAKQTPRCCPDGRHLVYAQINGARITLRYVSLEGADDRPLFAGRDDYIQQHPAWSADGRRLAFTVNEGFRNGQIGVHACDAEGLEFREFRAVITPGQNCQPAWSPDGRQLAYVALSHQLWIAAADGTSRRRLASVAGIQFWPAWSPDGRWIAFAGTHDGHTQLYRIRPDGSELTRLTRSEGLDTHPAYSPDGRRLAFASNRGGDYDIYAMPADGEGPGAAARNVTRHPARDDYPAWLPNGRELLCVSTRDGAFDIYRVPVELP